MLPIHFANSLHLPRFRGVSFVPPFARPIECVHSSRILCRCSQPDDPVAGNLMQSSQDESQDYTYPTTHRPSDVSATIAPTVVIKGAERFDEFTTVDWIQDALDERTSRREDSRITSAKTNSWSPWLIGLYEAGQSWLVVALAGACIGLNAAVISITTEWLSDLKMGICRQGWWLNQNFCCWEIEAGSAAGGASGVLGAGSTEEGCENWATWTTFTALQYVAYVVYSTTFAYASAALVKSFSPYAAGSGISEIKSILSGFTLPNYLGLGTLAIKSVTLPLAIASGLSVGKEGPSVHVAACIGNVVGSNFQKFSRSKAKMREVVTAASAAGVAVAFGSPVGGVLFAFEEMAIHFPIKTMWRSFFCALVATVTLSAMNPFRTGKLVLFQVSYDRAWHFFELGFFILIGVFGGLYGAFVIKYNLQVAAFRRRHLASAGISEAVILAMLTAMVGYFNKFLRIDMTESLDILFRECEGGGDYDGLCQSWAQWQMVNSLLLATVLRTCLVILSYGCKVPAGIFVPSMAVGATFGRMLGILVKALYRAHPHWAMFNACEPEKPCITPGTYALLGAAAALGGIMRITVSVVVIMFELTGALTYILPTMIVLMVTKAVSDQLVTGHGGIADQMVRFNGMPCLEKEDQSFGLAVGAIMTGKSGGVRVIPDSVDAFDDGITKTEGGSILPRKRFVLALPSRLSLEILEKECFRSHSPVSGWPIVHSEEDHRIVGYISANALATGIARARQNGFVGTSATIVVLLSGNNTLFDPQTDAAEAGPSYTRDELDLSEAVNQTPLLVSPKQPVELVMGIFKKLGPRTILIESYGILVGLVTAKDLLRYSLVHEQSKHGEVFGTSDLEDLLEESKAMFKDAWHSVVRWVRGGGRDAGVQIG